MIGVRKKLRSSINPIVEPSLGDLLTGSLPTLETF